MREVGRIKKEVIDLLDLNIAPDTPIYIGESNIKHMKEKHEHDYNNYGFDIESILEKPDYVGLAANSSIEYVKEYILGGEFVKVAVRVSLTGRYYVRTLYRLNTQRVYNFIRKGTLKVLTGSKE